MTAKQIWILAGPNGSGKSTLAPRLLRDVLSLGDYVNADVIAQGLSAFDPESVALAAGRIMKERLERLVSDGASFAFETTLASRTYVSWIRRIQGRGYEGQLIFLWLRTPDLAVERVRERARMGGHNIPEEVIRRRYERGKRNLIELYAPVVDTWCVLDNSETSNLSAIAFGRNGKLVEILEETKWQMFKNP